MFLGSITSMVASLFRCPINRMAAVLDGCSNIYADSKLEAGRDLLTKIGLSPEQILLVGDTTHDHEVAEELGCAVVLLAEGHQSKERLSGCGCPVLECATDVVDLVAKQN